jgi:hypothetical protein
MKSIKNTEKLLMMKIVMKIINDARKKFEQRKTLLANENFLFIGY